MPERPDFSQIPRSFAANIQALRIFADRIGRHADAHDRDAVDRFARNIERAFPVKVKVEVRSVAADEAKRKAKREDSDSESPEEPLGDTEKRSQAIDELLQLPEVRKAFADAFNSFSKEAPLQGALLRRSAVVTLMSYFEALIADLVHAFYIRFPSALPAEQRSLTLAELRELGSVDEAVQYLVAQEVDSILRESLEKQISYFTKPLKVDVSPIEGSMPRLIEVDQRRNIYVHNRGIVNHHYLKRVAPHLIDEHSAKDGEHLHVDEEYLQTAIDSAFVSGLILAIQCWAKWEKDEVEDRDSFIIEATFEGLVEHRYDVVKRLASYAVTGPLKADESRHIVIVNHAIALKESGDIAGMEKLLAATDWSATGLRFKLALCSLRSDQAGFFQLLPRAIAAEEVTRDQLVEWPVYASARCFEGFEGELDRLAPLKTPEGK